MLYLTGNDRDRYKVEIERINGRWVLWDKDWIDFVDSNVLANTEYIHFIRQSVDSYYVTLYEDDDSECYGYDRNFIGPRHTRCLVEYTPGNQMQSFCKTYG
ncbi:hypothetical protein CTI12_AA415820 [Artemisia annua]|uniref:Uncharacterized protein n=1 Tax=Artemisia annua TaxID=35608 RepID=A0A2U1M682_ARTAN|nr:hypothetical protein CTI12_AA415820 [Artemisia annua]